MDLSPFSLPISVPLPFLAVEMIAESRRVTQSRTRRLPHMCSERPRCWTHRGCQCPRTHLVKHVVEMRACRVAPASPSPSIQEQGPVSSSCSSSFSCPCSCSCSSTHTPQAVPIQADAQICAKDKGCQRAGEQASSARDHANRHHTPPHPKGHQTRRQHRLFVMIGDRDDNSLMRGRRRDVQTLFSQEGHPHRDPPHRAVDRVCDSLFCTIESRRVAQECAYRQDVAATMR